MAIAIARPIAQPSSVFTIAVQYALWPSWSTSAEPMSVTVGK